jgi:hypothetical protein
VNTRSFVALAVTAGTIDGVDIETTGTDIEIENAPDAVATTISDVHISGSMGIRAVGPFRLVKLVVATTRTLARATGKAGTRLSCSRLAYVKKHRVRRVAVRAVATATGARRAQGRRILIVLQRKS